MTPSPPLPCPEKAIIWSLSIHHLSISHDHQSLVSRSFLYSYILLVAGVIASTYYPWHLSNTRNSAPPHDVEMPPKKAEKQGAGKKPSAAKIVEDKTFGMKNKKGAQTQKQIAQMTASVKAGGTPEEKKRAAEKAQREKEKAAAEEAKKEAMELFKPVQVQKVPFGVDPKTVLCQYYKKGHCEKGRKCKFSHDLAIERKAEKKDLYQDTRDEEEERKRNETSADWDEEKLKAVVLSKKGNQKTTTDKVCKYFIEAVEEGKYGWFWTCPNGGDKCMYQHKLPPGFVNLFSSLPNLC